MHVVIRLQNHGCKNHPFWWIVVSPKKRNIKGRFIEHIGYWIPHERKVVQRSVILNKPRIRHWLAMGAQVTPKIHRFLSWIDLLPAPLIKYGSKTVYDKPIAPIPRSTIKNFNRPLGGIFDTFYLDKISQNLVNNDLKRKIFYQQTKADEIPQTSEELEQSWNKLRAELYQIENDNKSANPLKREKLFEKINKIASDWYDEKQLEGLKQISLEKSKIKVDSKNLKEQIMIQNLAIETEQQLKSKINWLKELTPMTKEEAYTFINQQMNYPQKSEEILKEAFDYAHKTSQVVSKVMIEDFIRRKYTKFTVIADENHSVDKDFAQPVYYIPVSRPVHPLPDFDQYNPEEYTDVRKDQEQLIKNKAYSIPNVYLEPDQKEVIFDENLEGYAKNMGGRKAPPRGFVSPSRGLRHAKRAKEQRFKLTRK